jgi:hypothetical protein
VKDSTSSTIIKYLIPMKRLLLAAFVVAVTALTWGCTKEDHEKPSNEFEGTVWSVVFSNSESMTFHFYSDFEVRIMVDANTTGNEDYNVNSTYVCGASEVLIAKTAVTNDLYGTISGNTLTLTNEDNNSTIVLEKR